MDVREKLVELLGRCAVEESITIEPVAENRLVDFLTNHGVTVQDQDGCEYCNGLPFSQMEDFTMPNASKKDYDIVTSRYFPMCGRRLPQPPKGE